MPKKTMGAVAALTLTTIDHMLTDATVYQDLGPNHFPRRSKDALTRRLVRNLEHLGYTVAISPVTPAAL